MRQRIRLIKKIALIFACIFLSALLSFLYFGVYRWNKMTEHYEREIAKYKLDLSTNCYILKRDVNENNPVREEDLKSVKLPRDMNAESLIVDKKKLKKAAYSADYKKGAILYQNMVYDYDEVKSDLRACELNDIILPKGIEVGKHIDVRIRFPNGLDFVVLSKKKLLSVEKAEEEATTSACRLHLNAEEILRISSAVVDSTMNEGAYLYGTVYLDSMTQKESKITYPNNAAVAEWIKKDANVTIKIEPMKSAREMIKQEYRRNQNKELAESKGKSDPVKKKDWEEAEENGSEWEEEGDVIRNIDLSSSKEIN